ncbi:hypothetical protein EC890511_4672, partial [Escherichia coli 89.0511]
HRRGADFRRDLHR